MKGFQKKSERYRQRDIPTYLLRDKVIHIGAPLPNIENYINKMNL